GARLIVAPCRSCKGKGQTLLFLKCKDCDGIGKKMVCPTSRPLRCGISIRLVTAMGQTPPSSQRRLGQIHVPRARELEWAARRLKIDFFGMHAKIIMSASSKKDRHPSS